MNDKNAQIEFNWIFALIIGAVILFLAVFFTGRLMGTQRYLSETELSKNFDILLNPFTSIGGIGKITMAKTIEMPQTVQINQTCNAADNRITLFLRSESSIGKKWGEWSAPNNIYNKYIFSNSLMEAKNFDVFGMPLYLPFRIDDLVYVIDKYYCFVNAPSATKSGLEWFNLSKVQFSDSDNGCRTGSLKVCFNRNCDITVTGIDYGTVQKGSRTMSYITQSLMYAAIFSDSAMYNCEFSRIMARLQSLADIYKQKASILAGQGCNIADFQNRLDDLKDASSSASVQSLYMTSKEVDDANPLECPIF